MELVEHLLAYLNSRVLVFQALVNFTDEEGYGRYLDLNEVYQKYINLKGIEASLGRCERVGLGHFKSNLDYFLENRLFEVSVTVRPALLDPAREEEPGLLSVPGSAARILVRVH